jgi:WD40 repeat protein
MIRFGTRKFLLLLLGTGVVFALVSWAWDTLRPKSNTNDDPVWSISYSPDGQTLYAAGRLSRYKGRRTLFPPGWAGLFNGRTGREQRRLLGFTEIVSGIVPTADGKYLITYGSEGYETAGAPDIRGEIKVWDANTFRLRYNLVGHDQRVKAASVSPDSRLLATVSSTDGRLEHDTIKVWRLDTGQAVASLNGHFTPGDPEITKVLMVPVVVNGVAYSPDGKMLATCGCDNLIHLWDPANGYQLMASLTGHTDFVSRVTWTPDSTHLVSTGRDGQAIVWDVATRKIRHTIPLKHQRMQTARCAISSDGKTLATADSVEVRLWNLADGGPIRQIPTKLVKPCCVAFSPDGKYLAIGGFFEKNWLGEYRTGGFEQWDLVNNTPRRPND